MKKTFIAILISIFTATFTGHAQVFQNQETTSENTAGFFNNPSDNQGVNDDSGGLFRSDASSPGSRPGRGEGIGQEAPLGNGLNVYIAWVILFALIIFWKQKKIK